MVTTQHIPLQITPVVSYPRKAVVGKTYLMTIDVRHSQIGDQWPYEAEEYPLYCILDTGSLFTSQPIGEPAVVIHRFGCTYGPAEFLLTADQQATNGAIRITLVNAQGFPVKVLYFTGIHVELDRIEIDIDIVQPVLVSKSGQTTSSYSSRPRFPLPPHNLPKHRDKIVGRESELKRLRELMHPANNHSLVMLHGIDGVGKTTLALELAYYYAKRPTDLPLNEQFVAIIWISAKYRELSSAGIVDNTPGYRSLADLFRVIATQLGQGHILKVPLKDQRVFIQQALRAHRTLLIIDNFDTVTDEVNLQVFLQDIPAPTKVLLTSRRLPTLSSLYEIPVPQLTVSDARTLIEHEAVSGDPPVTLSERDKDELADASNRIPLAIVWSIGLLRQGQNIDLVITQMRNATGELARYCFESSMMYLREDAYQQATGYPAYRLLLALSLAAGSVERQILGTVAGLANDPAARDAGLAMLRRLALVEVQDTANQDDVTLKDPTSQDAANQDDVTLKDPTSQNEADVHTVQDDVNLKDPTSQNEADVHTVQDDVNLKDPTNPNEADAHPGEGVRYTLLPLTRTYAYSTLRNDATLYQELLANWIKWLTTFAQQYADPFWLTLVDTRPLRTEGKHLVTLAKWAQSEPTLEVNTLIDILPALSYYLYEIENNWSMLQEITAVLLPLVTQNDEYAHIAIYIQTHPLRWMRSARQEFKEVYAGLDDALERARRIKNPTLECDILRHYALELRYNGRYAEALDYCDQAWSLVDALPETYHLHARIGILFERGRTYIDQEKWGKAEQQLTEALGFLGYDPSTSQSLPENLWWLQMDLALVKHQRRDYDTAKMWYQQALRGCRNVGDITRLVEIRHRLAKLEKDTGNPEAAREYATQALGDARRWGLVFEAQDLQNFLTDLT